jgi:hypothetical protein
MELFNEANAFFSLLEGSRFQPPGHGAGTPDDDIQVFRE